MPLTVYGDQPDQGVGSRPAHRSRRRLIGLIVLAVVVIGGLIVATVLTSPGNAASARTPVPSTPASTATPTDAARPEVAPGLKRGAAAITAAKGSIEGIRIGYERTVDGAAGAAMNYAAAIVTPPRFVKASRDKINAYLCLTGSSEWACVSDKAAATMEGWGGFGDDGQGWIDGQPNPRAKVVAAGYPEYGAYRVVDAAFARYEGDGSQGPPMTVSVEVWWPYVLGNSVDGNYDKVTVSWFRSVFILAWYREDWRIRDAYSKPAPVPDGPREQRYTNLSFADRAKLLGPGWSVAADAVEQALPGRVKTR